MIQTLLFALSLLAASATAQASLDIPKLFKVSDAVFRGAQPEDELDYDYLKAQGVKSIINLRRTRSAIKIEAARAAERGIGYLSVPMRSFFSPGDTAVNQALAFVTDPANQPVFVHCRKGKDRTGLVIGLYRVFEQGWNAHDAYAEMRSFGFNPWLLGLEHMYWKRVRAGSASSLAADDLGRGYEEDEAVLELQELPEAAW